MTATAIAKESTPAHPPNVDGESVLAEAVARAVDGHDTIEGAAKALLEAARNDSRLYREMMASAEWQVAAERVRAAMHAGRSNCLRAVTAADAEADAAMLRKSLRLMEFRLPGGLPLRKATAADLKEAAEHYHRRAKTEKARGDWLLRVRKALPQDKTVGEALSEADLIGTEPPK